MYQMPFASLDYLRLCDLFLFYYNGGAASEPHEGFTCFVATASVPENRREQNRILS